MRFSNDDCIGPRIVPFQYRMSSLSSVVVCLCQREDDEDKGESSTRQNSHAERTKNNKRRFSCIRQISCPNGLAQSKRGETTTTPTTTTPTKQAQRERRATRRRNRLNVALTSIGEPERAVVRVHSCPFLPGFQLFQKFKRSRDDDFFSSSALLLLLLRRRAPTSSKHDDADSLSFASLTSSWESRRRKWRRRLQKDGREVRTLNITFIDFRVKLKAFRATSSMSSSSHHHYNTTLSLPLSYSLL